MTVILKPIFPEAHENTYGDSLYIVIIMVPDTGAVHDVLARLAKDGAVDVVTVFTDAFKEITFGNEAVAAVVCVEPSGNLIPPLVDSITPATESFSEGDAVPIPTLPVDEMRIPSVSSPPLGVVTKTKAPP